MPGLDRLPDGAGKRGEANAMVVSMTDKTTWHYGKTCTDAGKPVMRVWSRPQRNPALKKADSRERPATSEAARAAIIVDSMVGARQTPPGQRRTLVMCHFSVDGGDNGR